ncbi:alpha/beta-hydrolase [Calocera viscosa TUFC12733]|uniref:triacylglycerol lipase n=1 Tax=Calocera viscosa (strain TUFC12733) TaxID=1330018 RepID=A0A167QAB6_CALVF|nr:alpha/beta-hydrolase [Calocera viscosa TUFC12733]
MRLPSLPAVISSLLPFTPSQQPLTSSPPTSVELSFGLQHVHATAFHSPSDGPMTLFHNASLPSALSAPRLRAVPKRIFRPRSQATYHAARRRSRLYGQSMDVPWDEDIVLAPDVSDRETLLELAKMTSNAYSTPFDKEWYDLGERWNKSEPFGWEPDADGFRGHIFVSNDDPPTVVLSIKGTSLGIWDSGPTGKKDKLNDNLLFSCCCARVSRTWTPVCDCFSGGWKCDDTCLSEALREESLFYSLGTQLYNNLTYLYPDANVWVVGHSLGGSLAALLGLTFGAPVVSFEAPAERLASRRLHLPLPPADDHIVHVYHSADPIALGVCNGITSACSAGGYAIETKCHNGLVVLYNTVDRGWRVDIRTHSISVVIEKVLSEDWEPGTPVPTASRSWEEDCVDCFKWEFGDYKNVSRKAVEGGGCH